MTDDGRFRQSRRAGRINIKCVVRQRDVALFAFGERRRGETRDLKVDA